MVHFETNLFVLVVLICIRNTETTFSLVSKINWNKRQTDPVSVIFGSNPIFFSSISRTPLTCVDQTHVPHWTGCLGADGLRWYLTLLASINQTAVVGVVNHDQSKDRFSSMEQSKLLWKHKNAQEKEDFLRKNKIWACLYFWAIDLTFLHIVDN